MVDYDGGIFDPDTFSRGIANEDYSNQSFINDLWLVKGPAEIILKTFAYLPVVLFGIFGNVALLYVIAAHRHLRSPTNLLVGNMAVSDLISLMVHPWVLLCIDLFQNYPLGAFGCRVEPAFECTLLLTGVMNLSVISYDRLTAIVLPQETRLTRKAAKIVMAVTWIAGAIIASPLVFFTTYKERQWLDFLEKYCTEEVFITNIYWHVIITMMVWLPLIIMLVCYVSIFVKLDRYEKKVKNRTKSIIQVKYKAKVAKTMFIIVIFFVICHLPLTALIFYRNQLIKNHQIQSSSPVQNLVNGPYKILWYVSKFALFLNSAINPVIYGFKNEKFLKVFKETAVINLIFIKTEPKVVPLAAEEKKKTKETYLESNRNKLFTIFKARSPNIKSKGATITEKYNSIINI